MTTLNAHSHGTNHNLGKYTSPQKAEAEGLEIVQDGFSVDQNSAPVAGDENDFDRETDEDNSATVDAAGGLPH